MCIAQGPAPIRLSQLEENSGILFCITLNWTIFFKIEVPWLNPANLMEGWVIRFAMVRVRDSPTGIFGPWVWWSRALARWESCWDVAGAVVPAAVTWKFRSETVLVFGPESVSYERSRHENWTILHEISVRVFFVKIQKIIFPIFPGYGEIGKIQFPIFPGYEKLERTLFPIFPGYEKITRIKFPSISKIGLNQF